MKILIIHGDHTVKSKEKLQSIIKTSKEKSWEVVRVSQDDNFSISERLSSGSLFNNRVLYVIDDYKKITPKDLAWIKKNNDNLEGFLVIYNQSQLSKTAINMFPKKTLQEEYSIPKLIWKFFDSIYPNNAKQSLTLLHEVIKKEPIEFVFHLMARHIKDLYWVAIDPKGLDYQPWRIGKLKSQSSKFEVNKLKVLIKSLAELDIKVKTSRDELLPGLDFTIATHLE
jgi:DNA polymerase III delta subunit